MHKIISIYSSLDYISYICVEKWANQETILPKITPVFPFTYIQGRHLGGGAEGEAFAPT